MAKQSYSGREVGSGRVVARGLLDRADPDEMGVRPVRVRKRAIPVDVYDSSDGLLYNELESMRNKLTRAKNSLIRANHEISMLKGLVDRTTEAAASVQRENGSFGSSGTSRKTRRRGAKRPSASRTVRSVGS